MKKLILFVIVLLIFASCVSANHSIKCGGDGSECELLVGNNLTTSGYGLSFGYQGGERRTLGNTFTLGDTKTIYGVSLDVEYVNNPEGAVAVIIDDDGAPYQTPGNMACGDNTTGAGLNGTSGVPENRGWNNFSFNAPCELAPGNYFLFFRAYNISVDGNSYLGAYQGGTPYVGGNVISGRYGIVQSPNVDRDIGFYVWGVSADTTPAEITKSTYNNTGGIDAPNQTAWADISIFTESRTEDDTVTITCDTTETATCAIGLTDLNISDMLPDFGNLCATSEAISHSCTLNETFRLQQENQPLFIACNDTSGNENATSTSGPLNITLGYKAISGFIKDNVGTGLSGATVVAVKQETKESFNTTTSGDGSYSLYVFKGNYSVFAYNMTSTTEADIKSYIVVE